MPLNVWPARAGLALLVTVAVGFVGGPAAAASHGWATAGATKVTFTADHGVGNKVVITRSGRTVTIDDRVAVKPGKGCKQVKGDKTRVRCKTGKAPAKVVVDLWDRDDSVVNDSDLKMVADGGAGSDRLVGGPKADELRGDSVCINARAGNDKIYGRGGNDQIYLDDGADYASGGDGNDWIFGDSNCVDGTNRPGKDVIHGGNGNDTLQGDGADDTLYGGNGADGLIGSAGRDRLEGGAGDDWLVGDVSDRAAAADVLLGGAGRDSADYSAYRRAVTVDLDGAAGDDGLPGERDTVGADVEDLAGTDFNDRLVGNGSANEIHGHRGDDVILGGGGKDHLLGWEGRNELYGEAGDDILEVAYGVSRLDGGENHDACRAKPQDVLISCEEWHPW
ncbi:calcium-binding protein [Actinoplanes sp. NPDC049118]|uniref:calcium-binding protein n=1 Tax=Actinoplanes sp. NPDC049118 TaxID=3155769 RepID=UPI0033D234D3